MEAAWMAGEAERLPEECNREPWLVNQMKVGKWFDLLHQSRGSWQPRWQLLAWTQKDQQLLNSMLRGICTRNNTQMYYYHRHLHPWQMGLCSGFHLLSRSRSSNLHSAFPILPNSGLLTGRFWLSMRAGSDTLNQHMALGNQFRTVVQCTIQRRWWPQMTGKRLELENSLSFLILSF